ncbi:MAG: alpha/beta hydrolase [Dermatophilaceae bacterium]
MSTGFPESEFVVVGSPVRLRESAGEYGRFASVMGQAGDVVVGVDSSSWVGTEGELFRARQAGLGPPMEVAQTSFGTVARVLGGFADEVESGQSRMGPVREAGLAAWARVVAVRAGLAGVQDRPLTELVGADAYGAHQVDLWRSRAELAGAEEEWQGCRSRAAAIREGVEAAADQTARTIRAAAEMADLVQIGPGSGVGGVVRAEGIGWFDPGGPVDAPPGEGGPGVVAAWWAALTPRQQSWVVAKRPGWVANLDGVPFAVRDAANRARVAGLEEQVRAELAVAEAELAAIREGPDSNRVDLGLLPLLTASVQRLQDRLEALTAIRAITAKPDRRLLVLDPPQEGLPRAAVAVGDLDTADKVAVLVPGFTSTVAGMGVNVDDMADIRDVSTQMLFKYEGSGSVATVAWLDYDIPQDYGAVADTADAEAGGRELAGFLRGVNASRVTDPDLTVLGHSYGSITTGYGLQQPGTGTDRVVFFGSPGIGTDQVGDLRVPAGSAWYAEANKDQVGDLAAFGADLSHLPGVKHLETGPAVSPDGRPLAGVLEHSFYLVPDTTSQHNLAAIVAGHPELTIAGNNLDGPDVPWQPWG